MVSGPSGRWFPVPVLMAGSRGRCVAGWCRSVSADVRSWSEPFFSVKRFSSFERLVPETGVEALAVSVPPG